MSEKREYEFRYFPPIIITYYQFDDMPKIKSRYSDDYIRELVARNIDDEANAANDEAGGSEEHEFLRNAKEDVQQVIKNIKNARRRLVENIVDNLERVKKSKRECEGILRRKVRDELRDWDGEIKRAYRDYLVARRERASFRVKNRLQREAQYAENYLFPAMLVISLVIIETAFNAYSFRNMGGGLFGGMFYAFSFSLGNMLIAYMLAWSVSGIIHEKKWVKALGFTFFIPLLLAAFLWNLIVAHYRFVASDADMLITVENVVKNLKLLLVRVFQTPFEIDMNGVFLMFIGLMIFYVAAVKFYRGFSDPYIGYTRVDWRFRKAEDNLNEVLREARYAIMDLIEEYKIDIEDMKNSVLDIKSELLERIVDYKEGVSEALSMIRQALEGAEQAINTYRKYMREAMVDAGRVAPERLGQRFNIQYEYDNEYFDIRGLLSRLNSEFNELEIRAYDNIEDRDANTIDVRTKIETNINQTINELDKCSEIVTSYYTGSADSGGFEEVFENHINALKKAVEEDLNINISTEEEGLTGGSSDREGMKKMKSDNKKKDEKDDIGK